MYIRYPYILLLVPSSRIEREAFRLGGERSILLSYEGINYSHFVFDFLVITVSCLALFILSVSVQLYIEANEINKIIVIADINIDQLELFFEIIFDLRNLMKGL